MALLPTLPGINAPIDRTEQKLDKLAAKSAAKKILLAERSGMSGGATVPDPWKNHDRAVFLLEQEKLAADARNEQAIVSDDDLHTFWGSRTQEGASIATGTARLVGDVASAPATAFADAQLSGVSDEMRALYDVEQGYKSQVEGLKSAETALQFDVMSGKLGPIEAAARRLELRNQQKALVAPDAEKLKALDVRPEQRNVAQNPTGALAFAPSDYQDAGLIEQELSPRERIEAAKNALKFAGTVDKSIEGITEGVINPLKRDVLNADMNASVEANKASFTAASAAWDKGDTGSALLETGKGIAGLVKDFGANALDNPDAALEYIAENVPQLALGAAGKTGQLMMAQTNLAYGVDIYRKGLEDYQAKNEGKLPTQAEATEMLGWSLSAAAAEQVGDMLTLSPLKGPLSKVMEDAFTQVKAGKLVTAAKELGRVPAAVASGVISEAPTEGYQTAVEENLSKLNTDFDFNTIAKASGIGGIVGGGLKGGIETLVQTGDIVSGGALTALGNQADSLKDKAKGVVDADAAKVEAFEEAKTTGDVDKLIDFNADTFNPTAAITAMHHYTKTTEDDVDPEDYVQYGEGLVGVMEQQLTAKEEAVKALPEDATETNREALVQDFEATREQVASMKLAVKSWRDELSGLTTVEDIDAAVAEADTDITEADETVVAKATESTSKVMTLAMNRSSKVTPEQLESLASNTSNVLSTEQRSFLTRAADARRAINALKNVEGVSKEVFSGGNGNFGLNDYQKDFDTAYKAGNTEQATRALSELTRFTEGHRAKFNLFSRAFDASEKAGGTKTYSFLPVGNNTGKWVVAPKGMSWDDVRKKGGVNISARNSGKLLNAVQMEVKALEASTAEMTAALKVAAPVQAQAPAAPSATKKRPKPLPVQAAKNTAVPAVTQVSDETLNEQLNQENNNPPEFAASNQDEGVQDDTRENYNEYTQMMQDEASAQPVSASKSEPQAKAEESTAPVSPVEDFEAEVSKAESDFAAAEAARVAEADAAEAARRTQSWVDGRVAKTEARKSDYLGQTAGMLTAFNEAVVDRITASLFREKNLLSAYFKQVAQTLHSTTPRPLVAVSNFMAHVKVGDILMDEFLSHGMTEAQAPLVALFIQAHDKFVETINKVVPPSLNKKGLPNKDWYFREPVEFFRNEDGKFDANFLTAMAAGAFALLAEEVNTPMYRTNEEIAMMLGLPKETDVGRDVRDRLRPMLARRFAIENKLGQFITDSLGIKIKDENTPVGELDRLRAHLGAHALNMLVELNLLQLNEVDIGTYAGKPAVSVNEEDASEDEGATGDDTINKFRTDIFVSVPRDGKKLIEPLERIKSVSKGTGGVLATLFGMESAQQMPLLEPPKVTQEDTNGGLQKVSKSVKRAMSKFASRQMSFRPAMTMLISAEQGFLEDIAGIENVEKLVMHAELRESAQAANDNLRRELEQLQDLWMHLSALGTPFRNFFSLPDQWKNSRIGYTGSWANMQTSKIARFLVSPVGWESEVVIDGSVPSKNQTSLDNFKLRVMEALGAKTDSQSDDVSLANWDKMTNDMDTAKHIVDAVAALRPVVALPVEQQKLSKEAQATIANAVLKSKTKLHGFEALVALAQYENAKAAGESSFKAIVTSEVDGKTNGPMLSMWLLGVMDSTFAAMGGFFTHVSQVRSFGEWKPGNYDLYERTASSLIGRLLSRGFEQKSLDALFNLLGSPLNEDNSISKAGRDLVKNPLTTLIYGSGLETTVEKMTDVFIENVYKTMGQIVEGKAYGAQKLTGVAAWAQYQEDLKEMTGMSQYLFPGELEQAMETPMEAAALSNLREEFKESIGKAVKDTINEDFKDYMDARKQMVRQANGVWTMYDMVRTKLLDDLTEQLMDWGEIDFQWITVDTDKVIGKDKKGRPVFEKKKVRQPLRELTPAEKAPALEAIKDMEPRINTALSKRDGQLDAGIYVSKSARKASNSPTHTTDVKGVVNGEKTNHKSKPVMRVESNPGVSIMANGVQSLDGNTIVEVLAALNLVGVHDAVLSALHDAAAAGQAMNQQVMDMLLNHSLPRESYESLERTLKGFAAYIEQNPGDISKEALGEVLNSQKEDRKDRVSFTILVQRAARFAHEADYNRLDGLSQLAVVDQYTIAAGIFDVPNSFNNLAAKKRDALSPKIDPALLAIAAQLDEIVFAKKVPVAAKTAAKKTRSTQGTDFDLDALLQTEGITANEVAAKLFNSIGTPQDGDTMGKLYREILKRGIKQLQGLPIVYATSDSQIPEKAKDAYGWYHVDAEGKAHLGIRGTSMGGSGVTTELVVHEILHAMVAWIIDQAEKGHGSPEVLAAVADLEALRKELKPLLEAEHSEAVSTLQEFVAWGMTNPAFQKAMAAVPMVEKGFAALKNKAQQFFRAISTIVFGVRGPAMETALSMFMARVSVIVGESETTQATQAPGTYRMAAHNFNAVGLFNGLAAQGNGYTDPYLQERVAGLMTTVVDAVGGPFQQFYQQIAQSATTPAGLVANAQQQGLMPVTAGLRTSGFALGDQQAYAIEVLTETFKAIQRNTTGAAQQQLLKLFKETSKQVTAADLGGQAQWDAIFGAEAIDTNGDYLARFAAMALAYPPLVAKMGFTTQEVVRESTTLYGRLVAFFEGMMNALSKAAHKAYAGQRADAKLDTLTKRLVLLEAKYQLRQQPSMMNDLLDGLEDKLTDVGESARKKLIELSQSSYLGGANNLYLKTAGNVVKMVAEQRVGYMLDNVEKIYNRSVKGQMGILGSLFNELRGTRDTNIMGRALMIKNKSREKEREDINRDIAKVLADPFKELSKKESDNITKVLLRTDVQALWGTFTDVEIRELLSRPAKLNAAIVQYQNQLPAALKTYYENQSDFTAFMLAVGEDKGDNTQLNIHNIADLSGTKQAGTLSDVEVEANIKVLDVLVTLKALKFTNEGDRQNMASLMLREPEGVKTALLMHRGLMEKARTETFVGTERLMRKGYVPEIHNPHVELVPVPEGAMEDYIKQGYKYHYHLPADPADVTYEPRVLMSVEKMTPRIVSGTLSITSMQSQGSAVHSGLEMYDFSGVNTFNQHTNKRIAKKREQHIDRLFKAPHGKNLFDMQVTRMTPISNPNGEMVGYRYMMGHENRDILLERNNNFAQVLAEMASTVFDKQTTPVHNREVLTAIKDQWEIEQSVNPEAFLLVGLDSADKDLRERYLAIPYETRKDIARIWGDNNMMIRRDLIDLHLGYRKASLTDLLTDNGKHEGIVKDFFLWLAKDVFNISPKGLRRILKAENIIMAVNQEIKDFFVVKSGVTTFWNIVSNLTLLKLYGVSIQEIVRSHKTALMGARDWQKHDSELRRLKAMKDSGLVIGSSSEMDQQIAVLEDQMARNPVREVMLMGMMPTIVEDMDAAEDPYSYKSYAARKAEKVTQYIPGFVKQGAKWVYMTHDTGLYQIMSQGAQMSDFVARYTLFEHLKTRRKNPLATGEAAIQAIDAFINYDLPSNRWVQYANDMGIVRFTKYYLRIQAVLAHLYQNNPARALFLATIENYFSGLQTVMDSSLWNRIGSPLEGGPFDALEAIESGLVSRMLGKVF